VLEQDADRGIWQPRCLQQWHHDVCGHHSLFNVACLLRGDFQALLDERRFWASALGGIAELARYGEASGRWPRSRVSGGVADDVHIRHLVESSEVLRGRVCILSSTDALAAELRDCGSALRTAMDRVRLGRSPAHGLLLGATNHWYAAVAVAPPGPHGSPSLWLCDSYNTPMAGLRSEADVGALVEARLEASRDWVYEGLRRLPEWRHRPEEHLEAAFEDGVQEWWKGTLKSAIFWRRQPLSVRRALKHREFSDVLLYLRSLSELLGFPPA